MKTSNVWIRVLMLVLLLAGAQWLFGQRQIAWVPAAATQGENSDTRATETLPNGGTSQPIPHGPSAIDPSSSNGTAPAAAAAHAIAYTAITPTVITPRSVEPVLVTPGF